MVAFILSTVGTSLLTGGDIPPDLRALVSDTATLRAAEIEPADRARLEAHVRARAGALAGAASDDIRRWSAELNGLFGLLDGRRPSGNGDHHVFLCSDTWQGQAVGQVLCDLLLSWGASAETMTMPGLNTRSLEDFRCALSDLAPAVIDRITVERAARREVVFNLTGGFKSMNGFLQALGMLWADRCVYLFEAAGSPLLTLPRLPLVPDATASVREHFQVLRRLSYDQDMPHAALAAVPETLLLIVDGRCRLSEWGQVLLETVRTEIYRKGLQPLLSAKLRLTDALVADLAGLPPHRLEIINRRLDTLARFLDGGPNPDSLSFKKLKGTPLATGETHEVYAWSDAGAHRLFGRLEGPVLVLTQLRKHL